MGFTLGVDAKLYYKAGGVGGGPTDGSPTGGHYWKSASPSGTPST